MKTRMRNVMLGAMLVILLTAGAGYTDLSEGLVGYWSFDNPGDIGHDDSGTGNNGSIVGGATPTSGVVGGAVHFNGSAYIRVPDSPSLDFLTGARGTISAFIKVEPSSDEFGIVVKESSSSFPWTIAYEFAARTSGTSLTMLVSDGSNTACGGTLGGTVPKDSAWHHVAATWVPDDIRIYMDGVVVFQGNEREPVYTINNISDPVLIGAFRWNVGGMYRYMTGDMDEVRIYKRALSGREIEQLAGTTIAATIDVDPDTLNLSSKDKWVTCYIELPDGYDVMDIDGASVALEGIPAYIGAEGWARAGANSGNIVDHDGDGIRERMVKFDGSAVQDYLIGLGLSGYVGLTVTGGLVDGPSFEGIDVIRVTNRGN